MKILLVSPHPKRNITFSSIVFSSLTLKQLTAITPKKHSVEVVDEKFQKINFDRHYDLVGISLMTYNSYRGYQIADEFRKRGITVVLGGYHPTALPEEAKQHADAVVIGEAERTWPQLLEDLEKRKLKPFYRDKGVVEPENIPPARHDINPHKSIIDSIQASRGCPIGCKFCSIRNVEGHIYRTRKINDIINEIHSIKTKKIFFADSSLTIKPSFTKTLFKEMIGLNKQFTCFGNINVLGRDDKLLKLSSEAGCLRWLIGIESFNSKNIIYMGKKSNKVMEYAKAIKKIKDYGIFTVGMFIFGFDNDTIDVFDSTVETILELDLDSAFFNILTPYPGTPIYTRLEKEKRILTKDWSKYLSRCEDQSVVFKPKHMTPQQLSEGALKAAKEYYSLTNIAKRWLNTKNLDTPKLLYKLSGNLSSYLFYRGFINF